MIKKYGKLIGYGLCGIGGVNLVIGIINMIQGKAEIKDFVIYLIGAVLWAVCGIFMILNDKKLKEEQERLKKEKKKEKTTFTTKSNKKKYN